MSYILDALKKSEKDRQRGNLPDMLTFQDIVAEKPAKRLHWAYLLAAALILNAGIMIWQTGFSSKEKSAVAIPDTNRVSIFSSKPVTSDVPAPADTDRVTGKVNTSDRGSILIQPEETENVSGVPKPAGAEDMNSAAFKKDDSPPLQPVRKEETAPVSAEPKDELAGLDKHRIYRLRELPVSVRESLPSFAISALMYSETPSSRMVRVNNDMMHEGQEMAAGLKLKEIVNDGVVFRYRDAISFWVGVN